MTIDTIPVEDSDLPKRLRHVANQFGSIKEFAEMADIPYQNVLRYLKGHELKSDSLTKIIIATGASSDWLLTGNGTPWLSNMHNSAEVRIPIFDDKIYEKYFTFSSLNKDHGSLIQLAYDEMKANSSISLPRGLASRWLDSNLSGIVFFHYKRPVTGPKFTARKDYFVDTNDTNPSHGVKYLVRHMGSCYILKVHVGADKSIDFLDESTDGPLKKLSYASQIRSDNVIGRVLQDL